tara:strand:- start:3386 stop:3586 length:201 start_codon:yes stop_codon:yes gene_type:complete
VPIVEIIQEIINMAFSKTGVSVTPPKPVKVEAISRPGDVRDGMVWDGEQWVSEAEWKLKNTPKAGA